MKNIETATSVERKEFGKNVHVVLEFLRHATPGKNPDGTSADFITEGGKEMAKELGKTRPEEEKIAGYSSPAKRAQETGDLYLDNTDESIEVINRKLSEIPAGYTKQKEGNTFRMKTKQELAPVAGFEKIMQKEKECAKQQKEEGSKLDDLSLIFQFYLDNPELCKENAVDSPREAASGIAYRVATELKMTDRFYEDTDVRLINVTHGPKLEPFLKEVLGFNRLEEIGGAVKEGENVQFEVNINEKKEKEIKMMFRGLEYELNPEQIKKISELSEEYKEKLRK